MKRYIVGQQGQTPVSLLYLEDVTQPDIIKALEERIQSIDVDAIINTGELTEFIEDQPLALLPQMITTERPDTSCFSNTAGPLCGCSRWFAKCSSCTGYIHVFFSDG